jgi:hypothetical protein
MIRILLICITTNFHKKTGHISFIMNCSRVNIHLRKCDSMIPKESSPHSVGGGETVLQPSLTPETKISKTQFL